MNDGGEALREALRLNQRLWSIFQAALSEPDCPLPKDVRDNVLTLSLMIDRHVMARLGDLDGSKIQPILDINRAIAEGLAGKSVQPAATAGAAAVGAPETTAFSANATSFSSPSPTAAACAPARCYWRPAPAIAALTSPRSRR